MNIQRVKQGAKITLWNGIYMILLGLFLTIFVKFNMKVTFKSISLLWGFFEKYNSDIANLFYLFNIMLGVILISNGIIIIYLSYFIIKRKDKLTWVVLLLSGTVSWIGLLIISFFLGNYYIIGLSLLGWIIFIIGMLIPIQYYLEKNYKEY